VLTLTFVALLLGGTLVYAVGNVQGFGRPSGAPAAGTCSPGRSSLGALLPPPATVRVNVYNATDRQGLAATLAAALRAQGFTVLKVGNDPRHRKVKGRGEIRYGRLGALAARTAGTRMAGAKLVKDHRRDATIDLVAGKRFTGLRSPPPRGRAGPCPDSVGA
jgi:hypothetical protein